MIGVLKHTTATPAYFRCVLLEHRMQESPRRAKFLSALPRPATGRAPRSPGAACLTNCAGMVL